MDLGEREIPLSPVSLLEQGRHNDFLCLGFGGAFLPLNLRGRVTHGHREVEVGIDRLTALAVNGNRETDTAVCVLVCAVKRRAEDFKSLCENLRADTVTHFDRDITVGVGEIDSFHGINLSRFLEFRSLIYIFIIAPFRHFVKGFLKVFQKIFFGCNLFPFPFDILIIAWVARTVTRHFEILVVWQTTAQQHSLGSLTRLPRGKGRKFSSHIFTVSPVPLVQYIYNYTVS